MKTKMVHLMSLIKFGDLTKLADQAKLRPATLSQIINGKLNIENYPMLVPILGEYVKRRTIELKGEFDLLEETKQACQQLNILPLSEEMDLKKKLTWHRLTRMSTLRLLEVNETLNLRLKTQGHEDWGDRQWDDFMQDIAHKLNLKKK
jgi:hypothetical protein